MRKKVLLGKKGDDSEWIQDISCYFFTYKKNEKSDEFKKELHDLFMEYKKEGMEQSKEDTRLF